MAEPPSGSGGSTAQSVMEIRDLAQLRLIAHPARMRILQLFGHGIYPLSVKDVADRLGQPHARLHYHVRRLVEAGVLKEVDRREVNGIVERLYAPAADRFEVARELADLTELAGVRKLAARSALQAIRQAVEQAVERRQALYVMFREAHLQPDRVGELFERLGKLLDPYRHPAPGTVQVSIVVVATYPREHGQEG